MYFFRVDASNTIGTGHVMRCLTLADALYSRGARSHFLCRHISTELAQQIQERQHELTILPVAIGNETDNELAHSSWLGETRAQDAIDTAAAIGNKPCEWLIVDHYALDAKWETAMRTKASRICVIDDLADRMHDCDVLLDQNLYLDSTTRYVGKVPAECKTLLGPRYAVLRDEFCMARASVQPRSGEVGRILVTFGGIDALNHTGVAIEALARLDLVGIEVDIVIGVGHPKRADILSLCAKHGFHCHIQTRRMAELMLAADIAIGAGGSASWERCCMGLPTIAVAIACNQEQLTHDAALAGVLHAPRISFADAEELARHVATFIESPLWRQHISQKGMKMVDAHGVQRVLRAMAITSVLVRPAMVEDAKRVFEWRNHPSIREVSHHREPLVWNQHEAWFLGVLNDPDRPLLIGEKNDEPIGIVRFDIVGNAAEVSIYLAPARTAEGLGSELLAAAEKWLFEHRRNVVTLVAKVLESNTASHRLFLNSGYQLAETIYTKRVSS